MNAYKLFATKQDGAMVAVWIGAGWEYFTTWYALQARVDAELADRARWAALAAGNK